jgi:hypothetical protein
MAANPLISSVSSDPSVNEISYRIEEEFPLGDGANLNTPPGAGNGVP